MHVRPARVEDREQLLELWEHSVRATHRFLGESDVAALRPLVAEELTSDALDWLVLLSAAGAMVGFLGFARHAVEALFIHPDHHGQGRRIPRAHAQHLSGSALTVDVNERMKPRCGSTRGWGSRWSGGRQRMGAAGRPSLHMTRAAPVRPKRRRVGRRGSELTRLRTARLTANAADKREQGRGPRPTLLWRQRTVGCHGRLQLISHSLDGAMPSCSPVLMD